MAVRNVVVTGAAGFVGSQLAAACLEQGDRVVGIDLMTDYYDVAQKESNLAALSGHERFEFVRHDLATGFDEFADGADVVFHQAGQPGVRASWRNQFDEYLSRNVQATQRVLEACSQHGVGRLVYASSSSIYGNADRYPVDEEMRPKPYSPYGVTKLAGEQLCTLYGQNFGLSVASLRYFTVYGPGQRPDMATHRLFEAALGGPVFPLFGSGEQRRDFTYVGDVVAANLAAGAADVAPGAVFNVAGGGDHSMLELIDLVGEIVGTPVPIDHQDPERGDVTRTGANTDLARTVLGWEPTTGLRTGLEHQHAWHVARRN